MVFRTIAMFSSICLICFAGCQKDMDRNVDKAVLSNLAGVWKSDDSPWQITISEKGQVISAIHPFGTALVIPNKTTYVEMLDGSKSSYESGDFPLAFNPESRELEIVVNIHKVHIKFLENEIIGHTETIIGGVVSADYSVWNADVIDFFDYGPRFPMDPNNVDAVPTTFRKQQAQ